MHYLTSAHIFSQTYFPFLMYAPDTYSHRVFALALSSKWKLDGVLSVPYVENLEISLNITFPVRICLTTLCVVGFLLPCVVLYSSTCWFHSQTVLKSVIIHVFTCTLSCPLDCYLHEVAYFVQNAVIRIWYHGWCIVTTQNICWMKGWIC